MSCWIYGGASVLLLFELIQERHPRGDFILSAFENVSIARCWANLTRLSRSCTSVAQFCRRVFPMKIGFRFLALTGSLSLSLGVLSTTPVQAQSVQPLQYFAVPPCRIVDTRSTPGNVSPLIANTVREFRATGTNFSVQGGTSGSCNIPVGATSVFFNFTVTNASASGFLTAYPYSQNNATQPNSSVVNYSTTTSSPAIANGIAVPICNSATTTCAYDFYVAANQGTTDLVVDVVGYYAPDIGNRNWSAPFR
jgi:hypothetical protein